MMIYLDKLTPGYVYQLDLNNITATDGSPLVNALASPIHSNNPPEKLTNCTRIKHAQYTPNPHEPTRFIEDDQCCHSGSSRAASGSGVALSVVLVMMAVWWSSQ